MCWGSTFPANMVNVCCYSLYSMYLTYCKCFSAFLSLLYLSIHLALRLTKAEWLSSGSTPPFFVLLYLFFFLFTNVILFSDNVLYK